MSRDAFEDLLESLIPGAGGEGPSRLAPVERLAAPGRSEPRRTPTEASEKMRGKVPSVSHSKGQTAGGPPRDVERPSNDAILATLGLKAGRALASGGSGTVFSAHDPMLNRDVAVKISLPGAAYRAAVIEEARVTARLQHPAIVPIYRTFIQGSVAAIESRLAPTTTLDTCLVDWLTDPTAIWPEEARLRALSTLASALATAHAQGFTHGDVHPANVAVGQAGEVFLLDWSNAATLASSPDTPVLHGNPCFAAPERLRGNAATPAGDVWALGALMWQVWTGRPVRPRRPNEELGEYIARALDGAPPALAEMAHGTPVMEADVANTCAACLAMEPASRPSAAEAERAMLSIIYTRVETSRRTAEAERLMVISRDALARFEALAQRLSDERRVAAVQRAKVPGHAPIPSKLPLWDAEERVLSLSAERDATWVEAADAADRSLALVPEGRAASATLADLWWIRMEEAERKKERGLARVFERRVLHYDDGRYAHRLATPSHLSVSANVDGVSGTLHRFVSHERRLEAKAVSQHVLPIEALPLKPGAWLLTLDCPGFATSILPLSLQRLEQHRARVTMFAAHACGPDWVHIPAGPFRLGGDPKAREALDRCTPYLNDYFILRYPVRCIDWLAFLDALPVTEARRHAPAFGAVNDGGVWALADGEWALPAGVDPECPVTGVNAHDAEAYAEWRSSEEGRPLRLPGEEQWEKAARGVDGRAYPWGDGFDPTFALMRRSRSGPPSPGPVGAFKTDRSVYDVADMAGGVREWTSTALDDGQLVVRGGSWVDDADDLRCATRSGLPARVRSPFVGFRLVTDRPMPSMVGRRQRIGRGAE